MATTLTPEERAHYLKALDVFGPEAHKAGVEALKKLDSGEKPHVKVAADTAHHAAIDKLSIPNIGGFLLKLLKCLLKCASHIPNWPDFAQCVLACLLAG